MEHKDNDLDKFKDKLSEIEAKQPKIVEKDDNNKKYNSIVMRIATEIIAGVIFGFTIGYYVDRYFNTKPIFMILFLIISFIAAMNNIYKFLNKK